MTRVFLGGSRRLSRLPARVQERLDRIVEKRFSILVGDANGADKAIQKYLDELSYDRVEVFHSGGSPRNNLGRWPTRAIHPGGAEGTVRFYSAKDRAMADAATVALMLWDGHSVGTLMNCQRLLRQGKKVVLYVGPSENFTEFRSVAEWAAFLDTCEPSVRRSLDERWLDETATDMPSDAELFSGAESTTPQGRRRRRRKPAASRTVSSHVGAHGEGAPDGLEPPPSPANIYDPDFDGLLEAIAEQEIIAAERECDQRGWPAILDARPMLLRRYLALARATATAWRAMRREYVENAPFRSQSLPTPGMRLGFTEEAAFGAVVWWGFLAAWFANYEAGLRDLASAVGVPLSDPSRGHRRIVEIGDDLANRALDEPVRSEFKHHLRLCQTVRNTIHHGGVHDPNGKQRDLAHRGQIFNFAPGNTPRMPTEWHWVLRFGEAVRLWRALLNSPSVSSIAEIRSSNPPEEVPLPQDLGASAQLVTAPSRPTARYQASVWVRPPLAFGATERMYGNIRVHSAASDRAWAVSDADFPGLPEFKSAATNALAQLAMDLLWEAFESVEFEINDVAEIPPPGIGRTLTVSVGEGIAVSDENRPTGVLSVSDPESLATLRAHVLEKHLAGTDPVRASLLRGHSSFIRALDHFLRGLLDPAHAMGHFYSAHEVVEDLMAGRGGAGKWWQGLGLTKSETEAVTRVANDGTYDQR